MSREININRQKLGLEDLLFGVGIVTQIRAGQNVDVTKINAGNLPFDETKTLLEWAQSINLEVLGSMITELQAIYDNLTTIGVVEDNLIVLNTLGTNITALQSLYTNISKLQNIDTNMSKLQNIDTNMSKLQNIDTNMSKLQAIYTDLTKLESIYDNLTMLTAIYNNLTALNNINSQVIPNLTELLLVNDNAVQVAADKLTVATDKGIVAGHKDDVSAMRVAVEALYDTFDDRFLGVKASDPLVDNDGNILQDGAMYFNSSSHSLKVYGLVTLTWYTIPQIYLSGLLDVTLTSITTGDILTWNGTKWTNTRTPSFDSIKLNGGTSTAGTATWNNTELTYDIQLNNNVALQVGQEELVLCKNNTASLITNGRPVMVVGTNGNSGNILIDLHDGTKASARRIVGIATEDIAANTTGFVTRNGKVRGLNTTGSAYGETWLDGDILYVKATGALTKVEPVDTALKMPIAFVIHAHSNGTLYVRTTGIDENHDRDFTNDLVSIHSKTEKTTPVDADEVMVGDSTSSWSLKKITWANIKAALTSLFISRVTSTDNAIVRFDGTTGAVQNSGVIIDDSGNMEINNSASSGNVYYSLKTGGVERASLNMSASNGILSLTSGYTGYGGQLSINANGSERMRIDSVGNIGIGVTPSAITSGYTTLQINGSSGLALMSSGNDTHLSTNAYYNSGYKYQTSGVAASDYSQSSGIHTWRTAPSGTAGNAITWTNNMSLDASGKLILGANTFGARISITGDNALYGDNHMAFKNNPITNYGQLVFLSAAGTQVGYIQASSTATAYITSSDYRLKEDWKPMENSIGRLMELKPCSFKWKETGNRVDGFLAHELQEVAPEAVTGHKDAMKEEDYEISAKIDATYDEEGNELTAAVDAVIGKREVPDYQGIDQSKLVPLLTASLQDAVRIINDLKSRIEILEGAK